MMENLQSIEGSIEHVPTAEEVLEVIKQRTDQELIESRRLEDGQGLYLLEVSTKYGEEITEYGYMRKGRYPQGETSSTSIQITCYDERGTPYWETTMAEFIDGKWTPSLINQI